MKYAVAMLLVFAAGCFCDTAWADGRDDRPYLQRLCRDVIAYGGTVASVRANYDRRRRALETELRERYPGLILGGSSQFPRAVCRNFGAPSRLAKLRCRIKVTTCWYRPRPGGLRPPRLTQ